MEFHNKKALNLVHLAVQYRYWENTSNYGSFLKEFEELSKPDRAIAVAQGIHLEKVRQLLVDFAAQVETALSKSAYYCDFDIERTSFLNQMGSSHSWEVSFDLWNYIHLRMDYDRKERELATLLSDRAPVLMNLGFTQPGYPRLQLCTKSNPSIAKSRLATVDGGLRLRWETNGKPLGEELSLLWMSVE
jgi:hypothetical protein